MFVCLRLFLTLFTLRLLDTIVIMYCGTTIVRIRTVLKQPPLSMPVTHGLMKRGAIPKHKVHVGYRRSVPHVQRLIKRGASSKHVIHVGHGRCVPGVQRLIERGASKKHAIHSDHGRCVPGVQRLIERFTESKHVIHISHGRGVPVGNRFIELPQIVKQHRHVGDQRSVPGFNKTMTAIVFFTIVSYGLFQLLVATRLITCSHVMFVCLRLFLTLFTLRLLDTIVIMYCDCGTTIVRIRTVLKQHPLSMPVTHGLMKRGASPKHTTHGGHGRSVPHVQRLVERCTEIKHAIHVDHG